jgi:3-oxoacyl-[acyl-carrier protein] reductase
VCPGFIQGRWVKNALGDAYEEHKANWETTSPLRKAATPEEVATTILWLVESAALITGQTIIADAGMMLGPAGSGVMGKRR